MTTKPTPEQQAAAEREFYNLTTPVMDEEDTTKQETRQASLKTMEFFFRGLRVLAQYKGNRDMALDCFILAHGKGEMIGLHTAVEVAVKHFKDPAKKATVTKCIVMFRECLGIKKMPGQRDEKGCAEMSNARKKQLSKK